MGVESQVKINIITAADPGGVQQARSQFDDLFDDLKRGIAETLSAGGADTKFISHVVDEFERLKNELKETGATGEEFAIKLAKLEQSLQADAAAEEKRIRQLKTNFEMALHEKDAEAENAALKRRRREEDQLAAEQEAMASRRRIAALQEERETLKSVAMAKQMSTEQRIERGVLGQGAYDPREDVARLRQVEEQATRTARGMHSMKGSIGDAALAFAYFADDAQYGLRGIMNNIPQVIQMMGLGSGLAGAIGFAAVAVNFLWEKFGGAKEAAEKTDAAKKATEELTTAINEAADAAAEMESAKFDAYLAGLREATDLWREQKGHISEALSYQNELAKAEQAAALAKLEIERQTKLAGAKSDEERKSINADYDVRKSQVTQTGKEEAMNRAVEAQQLSENSLRARIKDAQGASDAARQTAQNNRDANAQRAQTDGAQSDQGRRNTERVDVDGRIKGNEQSMRQLMDKQQAILDQGGSSKSDVYLKLQASIDELQKQVSADYKRRDELALTSASDAEAMKTGNGLKYTQAKEEADKSGDAAGVMRYTNAENASKANEERAQKAQQEAADADEKIAALKMELTELEKKGVLLKKQQLAQQLEGQAAEAKRNADKLASDDKADQEHLKKQREEQIRKLENDAKDLEKNGLFAGAAAKRNEAEKLKAGDNLTPEQKRQLEREARDRLNEGSKKSEEYRTKKEAQDVGNKAGNLGDNLGEAGKDLKDAADKLKDGATEKELEAVISEFKDLAPTIVDKFKGQEKKFSGLLKQMESLKSQLKNMRGGANS